ncbi:hypothetical protein P3L10_030730 [Capsicum annuum]
MSKVPMPSVYKMIAMVMLKNGFEPGRGLGKDLQGIIEPIVIPENGSKYRLGYQPTKKDRIEDESEKSLFRPLPLLFQSFPVREVSNDDGLGDGIGDLFEGCNAVPEDFPKSSGVKQIAPGEALQNWTSTPLITRRPLW